MTITLDPIKHTGAAPEPIVLLAEAEQLTFTGATLNDNMAATILSPTGTALASGLIAGNAVTLDTRTSQAWDYISAQACGVTAPALLAIGDADALVAVMPVRVLRNNLYNLAPPSETVTVYPSMAELQKILAQIAAAETNLEALIEQAQSIDANIGEVVRQFQASITAAETLINQTVTTGVADINAAKTGAVQAVGNAQTTAVNAVTNAQTAAVNAVTEAQTSAVKAVTDKATEVSGELDGKVTAAQDAATAAGGHATAASNSASAALQSATIAAERATAAGQSASAAAKSASDAAAIKTELQDALTEAAGVITRVEEIENVFAHTDVDILALLQAATGQKMDGITFVHTLPNGYVAACGVRQYGQRRYVVVWDSTFTTVKAVLDTFAEKGAGFSGYCRCLDCLNRTFMFGGTANQRSNVTFREIVVGEDGAVTFGADFVPEGFGTAAEVSAGEALVNYGKMDSCVNAVAFGKYIISGTFAVNIETKAVESVLPLRFGFAANALPESDQLRCCLVSGTKGRLCTLRLDDSGDLSVEVVSAESSEDDVAVYLPWALGSVNFAIRPVKQEVASSSGYSTTGIGYYGTALFDCSIASPARLSRESLEVCCVGDNAPYCVMLRSADGSFCVDKFVDQRYYYYATFPRVRKIIYPAYESANAKQIPYIVGLDKAGVWVMPANWNISYYCFYTTNKVRFVKWEDIVL